MKKLMLILLVAVTTLGGTAYGQTPVAHVNTQKVLDTMPSRKSAMTELENFERRAVKELQETQQQLQADYGKLQQEKATMSRSEEHTSELQSRPHIVCRLGL